MGTNATPHFILDMLYFQDEFVSKLAKSVFFFGTYLLTAKKKQNGFDRYYIIFTYTNYITEK